MNQIYSTAYLGGGVGAQLFQISHACAQGWKYGIENVFCTKLYETYNYPSEYWPQNYMDNIYRNLKFVENIYDYNVLEESDFNNNHFIDSNIIFDKTVVFRGTFESQNNFMGYDGRLKTMFEPTELFIQKINSIYPEIKNNKTVSIHIRRGDFFGVTNILPVVHISYFEECINRIGEYDTLFIFSNDKEYANNLNFKNAIVVSGLETYEELWLMSLCKINIIANSTFSWWAQFLNKNENKKTYSPSVWFGPSGPKNYDNVFQKEWDIIKTRFENGYIIKD